MKKSVKIILGIVLLILLVWVLSYFKKSNTAEVVDFEVEEPYYTSIDYKVVATGKLNPEEEIELKPQISGIVDKIVVEEGDIVKKGDLIAKIRVVPNEQSLVSARSRIKTAELSKNNAETLFNRNKALFEKGVISKQDFENSELSYNQAMENLRQAQNDFQIIRQGSLSGGSSANTNIIAQISGTILEIPVREGDQVIQSNNFNAGTTIATIADMSNMLFEGKVDESPRKEIFYFDQAGNLNALRYQDWKLHFSILEGGINTSYRKTPAWPVLINLRADPYEVSWKDSELYVRWFADNMWTFVPAQEITGKFLMTFKDFPPVQGSSLGIDKVLQSMTTAAAPRN